MNNSEQEIKMSLQVLETSISELISFFNQELNFDELVYTEWSRKDILGHLVFWHESFARNLKDIAELKKPNPLKGKLSEVNKESVLSAKKLSIEELLNKLKDAQKIINKHVLIPSVTYIPYKKGSRAYTRLEHLEVVNAHIKRHLKDLNKGVS